jgi:hypothetical protein
MDDFAYVIYRVKTQLENINYPNGDISDIGNEIGIALGQYLSTEEELNDFIIDYSSFTINNNVNNTSIICFPLSPKPHEVYETDIIIKKYWK